MEHALTISKGKSETLVHEAASGTFVLEDEASLFLASLQLDSHDTQKIHQNFILGNGSKLTLFVVDLSGASEHVIHSVSKGRDAVSTITCVSYAKGSEHQKISATNSFEAGNGGGEILMKGVAEGNAQAKLDGKIEIGLKGGGTDTYLTQQVLMLDDTAKVDAIPQLEIKTNDVKASHSASVSRITPEDIFTFAARGIDSLEAKKMFILGFLADAVKGMPEEERILAAIEEKYARN